MTSTTPGTHSTAIRIAAKAALGPMGLKQRGKSRTWLDDQNWWVIVVEFQPSSYRKGAYLNVSPMWLWNVKPYISFDVGGRVPGVRSFSEEESEIEEGSKTLAARAAAEVARWRKQFPDLKSVVDYYKEKDPHLLWGRFHAAVAFALHGEAELARQFFLKSSEESENAPEWLVKAIADATFLSRLATDTVAFREEIVRRISQSRELLKLPPAPGITF